MLRNAAAALIESLRDAAWLTPARVRAYLYLLGAVTLAVALAWIGLSRHGLDLLGKPLGADFPSFWAASRLALQGAPAKVYDLAAHAAVERSAFRGANVPYSAFFYPPTYLLICLPLGLLPYLGALAVWLGAAGYACWRVVRAWLGAEAARWALPMLAFPGVLSTVGHGQNAFLTTALFGAAILMWDRRPLLAGVCFGLLTIKPQLGLMIPLALIVSGRWRVIASACATGLSLALAALAVFGLATWRGWLAAAPLARRALEEDWVGSEKMQSAFAAVRLLHGGLGLAYGVQAAVALAAAVIVVPVMRRRAADPLAPDALAPDTLAQGATLATASLLASPFMLDYDLMLLALPLAWLVRAQARGRALPWEKTVMFAAFLLPLISRLVAGRLGFPLGPPIVFALLLVVARRAMAGLSVQKTSSSLDMAVSLP
jgi:hypothetical protein